MVSLEDLSQGDTVYVDTGGVEFIGEVNDVQELGLEFQIEESDDMDEGEFTYVAFSEDVDVSSV
jgi:hypothetical protein